MNFEYIRSTYFPRWDRKHQWTLRDNHPECIGFGLCDSKGKIIVVRNNSKETLIHEISHAVTATYHDKRWQRRMEQAALKAESFGDKNLAVELRKNYAAYSDPNKCLPHEARVIYNQIEDAVRDTHGTWSFEEIVKFVADSDGMASAMMISKYRKLRDAYNRAKAEVE